MNSGRTFFDIQPHDPLIGSLGNDPITLDGIDPGPSVSAWLGSPTTMAFQSPALDLDGWRAGLPANPMDLSVAPTQPVLQTAGAVGGGEPPIGERPATAETLVAAPMDLTETPDATTESTPAAALADSDDPAESTESAETGDISIGAALPTDAASEQAGDAVPLTASDIEASIAPACVIADVSPLVIAMATSPDPDTESPPADATEVQKHAADSTNADLPTDTAGDGTDPVTASDPCSPELVDDLFYFPDPLDTPVGIPPVIAICVLQAPPEVWALPVIGTAVDPAEGTPEVLLSDGEEVSPQSGSNAAGAEEPAGPLYYGGTGTAACTAVLQASPIDGDLLVTAPLVSG